MDQKAAEVPEQPVPPEFPKTRGLMLEGRLGGGQSRLGEGGAGSQSLTEDSTVTVLGVKTRTTAQAEVRVTSIQDVPWVHLPHVTTNLTQHTRETSPWYFSGMAQLHCHPVLAVRPLERGQGTPVSGNEIDRAL